MVIHLELVLFGSFLKIQFRMRHFNLILNIFFLVLGACSTEMDSDLGTAIEKCWLSDSYEDLTGTLYGDNSTTTTDNTTECSNSD